MTVLLQVELIVNVMPSLLILCGYCTNIKLISKCFQAENDVTDKKVVTLRLHLKGNAELLSSCASI